MPPVGSRRGAHRPLAGAQSGTDIQTVQSLLGRSAVLTAMTFTHVLKLEAGAVRSPLDAIAQSLGHRQSPVIDSRWPAPDQAEQRK